MTFNFNVKITCGKKTATQVRVESTAYDRTQKMTFHTGTSTELGAMAKALEALIAERLKAWNHERTQTGGN